MPRALALAAALVALVGARTSQADGELPPSSSPPDRGWHSPSLAITGVVLASVGSAGLVAGAVVGAVDPSDCERTSSDTIDCANYGSFGPIIALSGLPFLAAGIPMIVIGAQPAEPESPPSAQLRVAPGGASLSGTF